VSRADDLPENNLQADPRDRSGTGPLFLQVKLQLKRVFQKNNPFNEKFSPALTQENHLSDQTLVLLVNGARIGLILDHLFWCSP